MSAITAFPGFAPKVRAEQQQGPGFWTRIVNALVAARMRQVELYMNIYSFDPDFRLKGKN